MKENIPFVKINATGNDFIVIDNRMKIVDANNTAFWKKICTTKIGIGADGVLLLEENPQYDFKMRYINADGGEVEMCGNGARAITFFAHQVLNKNQETYIFQTMNGVYQCSLDSTFGLKLKMTELYDLDKINLQSLNINCSHHMYLNTGVPHCVFEVKNLMDYPVFETGKKVRYHALFARGTNANFFEVISDQHIRVRTYERGVENETLSCGTGVTATAITAAKIYNWEKEVLVETLGGKLTVQFNFDFSEIYLCGKVEKIFSGVI